MKWVRGKYGNINTTGEPRRGAAILKSSHRQFWSAIEPGVKPLVRALVRSGYDTFSSCEGHTYPDGQEVCRTVDMIIEKERVNFWLSCLKQLNERHKVSIQHMLIEDDGMRFAMTRDYGSPIRFVFLIGMPSDKDTQRKTDLLLKLFKSLPAYAESSGNGCHKNKV